MVSKTRGRETLALPELSLSEAKNDSLRKPVDANPRQENKQTLCDYCDQNVSWRIVTWGRELNSEEQKYNDYIEREGKAEKCDYFERYFNKSFPKRLRHCDYADTQIAEPELEDNEREEKVTATEPFCLKQNGSSKNMCCSGQPQNGKWPIKCLQCSRFVP